MFWTAKMKLKLFLTISNEYDWNYFHTETGKRNVLFLCYGLPLLKQSQNMDELHQSYTLKEIANNFILSSVRGSMYGCLHCRETSCSIELLNTAAWNTQPLHYPSSTFSLSLHVFKCDRPTYGDINKMFGISHLWFCRGEAIKSIHWNMNFPQVTVSLLTESTTYV